MDLTNINKDRKERRSKLDMTNMVFGKVPPQAVDLEEAVLGAILLEKSAFDLVNDILQADCFYTDAHQRVFMAMQSLARKNYPIDSMTVVEELKLSESLDLVGGPYYISKLTNNVTSSANIEVHSRIVLQKFLMREIIRIGGEMVTQAYDDSNDVFDVLDFAEENVSGLRMNNVRKTFKTLQSVIISNLQAIEELRLKDEAITGVPSRFEDLDKITCGWQATDLIILAARPSVGKTAFSLTLAKNAAQSFFEARGQQKAVGFFSLEMSDRQLVNRVLSAEGMVWMWRIQSGRLEDYQMKQLYEGAQRLSNYQIFIDDTAALKIQEFKTKARIMVRKHNVGIIFVDYLQLMKDPLKKMREQEISSISSQLKEMAKELQIPIVALSQLSREFTKDGKGGREPQLSDLRESGAIEQDADMVMFLYKPSEAEIEADASLKENFYCKIEKFRNGEAPVKFIGQFSKQTQSHEWLVKVDVKSNIPEKLVMPTNFKPIAIDFTQAKSIAQKGEGDDLPF